MTQSANMLSRAAAHLENRRHDYAALDVVYRRGAAAIAIKATIGSTPVELESEGSFSGGGGGVTVSDSQRDYLIRIADLAAFWSAAGGEAHPARGDVIEQVVNGQTQSFELMPSGLEPVYRISGPYGSSWRVHTRRVNL